MVIKVIVLDTAKHVFQVHRADASESEDISDISRATPPDVRPTSSIADGA